MQRIILSHVNFLSHHYNVVGDGVHDVINCAFFENRPKGFGAGRPRNMVFPIDFAGRPYNTLTLPSEREV